MIKYDLSNLSKREKRYFNVMMSGNVLYIRGIPGMAKSAIGEAMCKKVIWWDIDDPNKKHTGIQYIDLRLSDKDETDLGSYPVLKNGIDQLLKFGRLMELGLITLDEFTVVKKKYFSSILSDDIDTINFAVPEWAVKSNTTPTIIHVEELNRCDIRVRNAALQLLNERRIGSIFQFNSNVLWMASGNLGETDKTEVEEMDLALSNRLTILDHELSADEWSLQYGREHCWGVLVDYVVNNPLEFYKPPADGELRYATARSWTNFSKYILKVYGPYPNIADVCNDDTEIVGIGTIGMGSTAFFRYLKETVQVSIKDVYERWDDVKKDVKKFNRARTTELLNNLKTVQLETIQKEHIENIVKFLKSLCSQWINEWEYNVDEQVYYNGGTYKCRRINKGVVPEGNENDWKPISETDSMKSHSNDDEITNYIIHLIDNLVARNQDRHKFIIRVFKHKALLIQKWVDNGRHKDPSGRPIM
jgi:hypothetical protein